MNRIPDSLLQRMAQTLPREIRDEMAIPSYLHSNPFMRWMAWRRVEVLAHDLRQTCAREFAASRPCVMDFGCGTGVLFDEASRYASRIYGVDVCIEAAKMLVNSSGLNHVSLLTPEQARRVIAARSLDIIIAGEVLEHLDPLESTLEFFQTRLRPHGRLLVSLPTENLLYRLGRRIAGFHGHYHHANADSIHRRIAQSGFRCEGMKKVPLPGPLAIYWIVRYSLSSRDTRDQ